MIDPSFVLRSVIHGDYLRQLLSPQYSLGPWIECNYLLRGLNDTYKVRTHQGFYVLRIYRVEVQEDQIQYELSIINKLSNILLDDTTQVAVPISKLDNSFYSVIHAPEGNRFAVLFQYAEGEENPLNDEDSCYLFGQSAAKLHHAMDQIKIGLPKHELDTDFLIRQPVERIINYVGKDHSQSEFLLDFANELCAIIERRIELGLDWGICHGDLHGNNNVQFKEGTCTHIDFEWSSKGWRSYDLAQVLISRRRHHPIDQANTLWNAIINGYRSVRHFSANDEHAVEDFVIVRRLWVMSLDVAFINSFSGSLDYGEDWLNGFINEFKAYLSR
ncbi:phosphotransferase [Paenibacillus sp. VCA1]|uniref:phosphotransferase enzyme family protein n=1 Tax=Paenibacillus sp. VCA1 TaxID=3039148 RepID=UPI002871C8BA|nr:phosphotransferase [Paenibacillus sp. VCA1]MDR9856212.1 phosphotransferase [Paenibacillus sp. VCA1]